MPYKLRLTLVKRWTLDRKKKKASNYRTGMPSPLFAFFRDHADLNVMIRDYLDKFEATDENKLRRKERLEATLASLPTVIPSRDGPAPIPGQRDHFYVKFYFDLFHYLGLNVSGNSQDRSEMDFFTQGNTVVYYRRGYSRNRHGMIGTLVYLRGVLHHFDDGPTHPHAVRPVLSKLARRHLKKMEAKRAAGDFRM